jgi:serine/threonine-protein kinase HipA
MNVFTNKQPAGRIFREKDQIQFVYNGNPNQGQLVALAMPAGPNARFQAPNTGFLHPVFAMNLPEGQMLKEIKGLFAKTIRTLDDLTLLEITGRSQTGCLRYAKSQEELDNIPGIPIEKLLKTQNTEHLFRDLLKRFVRYSGISGAQPKIMVRDTSETHSKITAAVTTHIIKFFNKEKLPALATNEHLCLKAAKNAGIPTPTTQLADDGSCLVVERFDLKEDGTCQAHEDCCTLAGLQPGDKYTGTYEQIAKTLRTIPSLEKTGDMKIFFKLFLVSMTVRNGDAHRKNFGVTYDTPDNVRLAPAYDIINTTAYSPYDQPGLSLCGSTKWPNRKKLILFGANQCLLSPQETNDAIDQVAEAIANIRENVSDAIKNQSGKTEAGILKNMLAAWEDGLIATCSHSISLFVPRKETKPTPSKKLPLGTNFEVNPPPKGLEMD